MNKYEAERALNVFAPDRVFLPSRIFLLAFNFVINSYKNVRFCVILRFHALSPVQTTKSFVLSKYCDMWVIN